MYRRWSTSSSLTGTPGGTRSRAWNHCETFRIPAIKSWWLTTRLPMAPPMRSRPRIPTLPWYACRAISASRARTTSGSTMRSRRKPNSSTSSTPTPASPPISYPQPSRPRHPPPISASSDRRSCGPRDRRTSSSRVAASICTPDTMVGPWAMANRIMVNATMSPMSRG